MSARNFRLAAIRALWILPLVALLGVPLRAEDGSKPKPSTETGPATDKVVETGVLDGAEYLIEIPAQWNGGLIMYAHGYENVGPTRRDFNRKILEAGANLGYAVAQSKYSAQGWAAREGVLETEALRRHFVAAHGGKVWPVIIAGDSQGGAITYRTIELFPEVYDGACPMCAVSEPALKFFKERVFDMRLLFDYYFPGLPGSAVEFPDGEKTMVNYAMKASQLALADPAKAEKFIRLVNLPDTKSIGGVIAFWSEILRELQIRTGGNAFDNTNTVYSGSDDDSKLNREIPRHKADAKSQEYLRQWVTPTGEIHDPVVALHTFVDQLIPADRCRYYENMTSTKGTSDLFVQLWVNRPGHCNFTEGEVEEALARLDKWIREGKRAEAGEITETKEKKK